MRGVRVSGTRSKLESRRLGLVRRGSVTAGREARGGARSPRPNAAAAPETIVTDRAASSAATAGIPETR